MATIISQRTFLSSGRKVSELVSVLRGCVFSNVTSAVAKISFTTGMAFQGPRLFKKIVSTRDHDQLDALMTKNIRVSLDVPLLQGLDLFTQEQRRANTPSARDQRENNRELMKFVRDEPENGKPPLAWVMIWRGSYSNLFGDVIPHDMKRWGYVIWDATRLVENGAKHLLNYQWGQRWSWADPRDVT